MFIILSTMHMAIACNTISIISMNSNNDPFWPRSFLSTSCMFEWKFGESVPIRQTLDESVPNRRTIGESVPIRQPVWRIGTDSPIVRRKFGESVPILQTFVDSVPIRPLVWRIGTDFRTKWFTGYPQTSLSNRKGQGKNFVNISQNSLASDPSPRIPWKL